MLVLVTLICVWSRHGSHSLLQKYKLLLHILMQAFLNIMILSFLKVTSFCQINFLSKLFFIYQSLHRMNHWNIQLWALFLSAFSVCAGYVNMCSRVGGWVTFSVILIISIWVRLNWDTIMTLVNCNIFISPAEIWHRVAKSFCRSCELMDPNLRLPEIQLAPTGF